MRKKYAIPEMQCIASGLRVDIIKMLAQAGSGHPGGSLSMVELLVALFFNVLTIDPENPTWEDRDRFHLSKGHGCPALYAVLAKLGYFPPEELCNLRQLGCLLQGHPHPRTPGIDVASGSLGQGLSVACGFALASRLDKKDNYTFTLLGDGELQEGQVWEAAMFAAHYRLDRLIAVVDHNGMQIDGALEDVMNIQPLVKKWESFGFYTIEVDGHDIAKILDSFQNAKAAKGKPKVIIAKTVKGKGVSFMEHNVGFHGKAPNADETDKALKELGGA